MWKQLAGAVILLWLALNSIDILHWIGTIGILYFSLIGLFLVIKMNRKEIKLLLWLAIVSAIFIGSGYISLTGWFIATFLAYLGLGK
jgi:hypothetical protein